MSKRLIEVDPEVAQFIGKEQNRQEMGLELIASENYCSQAVMEAQGSCLTNKYAEGYPGKRYYNGCEFVDGIETLAIERLKKIFNAKHANVQPHSGSQANMAVYMACLNPGEAFLGMDLAQGGHLTHGSPVNFSGKLFKAMHYGLNAQETIDYNQLEDIAKRERPRMIIAGASAYPRIIDFEKFGAIAKSVGAVLMVDMAHIAGLVAAGLHPSPMDYADVVTSTTHKTLRGPRGGLILTNNDDLAKKFNSLIFPGIQGGPLEHVIAGKAVAFKEALDPSFKTYQEQVVKNSKVLAKTLMDHGIELVSGGTDNHLVLLKTDSVNMSGKEAGEILERVDITCNKNMVPNDKRSPFVTSGIRLGTPAVTTRGFKEAETKFMAELIVKALKNPTDEKIQKEVKLSVHDLCTKFPVYK
ncbi:serine hydroxymethyltransferase [Peredibacter starrii]|uniref:Serine hydroxymethyltransferase n=1 Tax=Peredibacter starrii TaxID=28202 RepID=A0AAX4HSA8_9BACT|nr:serine hydroxymethyltransferase [Peredibacter starrii]WPU66112.1 serine hydroxymethyltransferase [Peredibacter starrii]